MIQHISWDKMRIFPSILPLYADRTHPAAHPIAIIHPEIRQFLPVATPRSRLKLGSMDREAGGMSQTKAIASINSLLLQLPEPLQVEALHYVEYLTSRRVGAVSQIRNRPETPKRNGFGILKGKVTIADDFDAPLEEFADYQ
jgi:Protein of unknown function (DUF2281)